MDARSNASDVGSLQMLRGAHDVLHIDCDCRDRRFRARQERQRELEAEELAREEALRMCQPLQGMDVERCAASQGNSHGENSEKVVLGKRKRVADEAECTPANSKRDVADQCQSTPAPPRSVAEASALPEQPPCKRARANVSVDGATG